MITKMIKYISSKYVFKESIKIIAGYSVYMLGNMGWNYFEDCDRAGSAAFLSYCGIGYVLVVIIKNFIKSYKNIKAGSKNKAFSLNFLIFLLMCFVSFLIFWHTTVFFYFFTKVEDIINNSVLLLFYYSQLIIFFIVTCGLIILIITKLIYCMSSKLKNLNQ